MIRRIVTTIAVLLAATASVGVLVASNMAHKASVRLYKAGEPAGGGASLTGVSTLNLPYDLGPNILNAKNLMDDITFANVQSIQRFLKVSDGLQTYTGRKGGGTAFPLVPGECYFVKMNATTDYNVVGSFQLSPPGLTLNAYQPGVSATGNNFVSLPFNITARTAKELMDDIGFANVQSVTRFLRASDGLQTYSGRKGSGADFPISYDECYFIKMSTTVNYTPTHY
jgi:hypothetical protein